jgi:hypothetical protein
MEKFVVSYSGGKIYIVDLEDSEISSREDGGLGDGNWATKAKYLNCGGTISSLDIMEQVGRNYLLISNYTSSSDRDYIFPEFQIYSLVDCALVAKTTVLYFQHYRGIFHVHFIKDEDGGKVDALFSLFVVDPSGRANDEDDKNAILLWRIVDGKTKEEKLVKSYGEWLTLMDETSKSDEKGNKFNLNDEMKANVYNHFLSNPYISVGNLHTYIHFDNQIGKDNCKINIKEIDLNDPKKGWTFGCSHVGCNSSGCSYVAQEHLPFHLYASRLNQFQTLPSTFVHIAEEKRYEKRHRFAVNTALASKKYSHQIVDKPYFFIISFPCQRDNSYDDSKHTDRKVIIEYEQLLTKDEKEEEKGEKEEKMDVKLQAIDSFIGINDQLVVKECYDLWLTDLQLTKKKKIKLLKSDEETYTLDKRVYSFISDPKNYPILMKRILPTSVFCNNLKVTLSNSYCGLTFPTDLVSIIFNYLVCF